MHLARVPPLEHSSYSSENQHEASIADRFRICREFARREGWTIAKEYSDHAVSGATLLRSGFQAMMASALRTEVDIVLAESLDSIQPRPGGHCGPVQTPHVRRR